MKFNTKLIHGSISKDTTTGAVSVLFIKHQPLNKMAWVSQKNMNILVQVIPRHALETLIAELEVGAMALRLAQA